MYAIRSSYALGASRPPRARPVPPALPIVLALLPLALGCGPSDRQVGTAVGLAAPLIILVEAGLFLLLRRAWQAVSEAPIPWARSYNFV